MAEKVTVVANGLTFDIPRVTHERWPEDFPLAETKSGRPTAAAKRATPAVVNLAKSTTKTADDLKAAGPTEAGDGDDTTKEA